MELDGLYACFPAAVECLGGIKKISKKYLLLEKNCLIVNYSMI
jgi:hypothetical protein